MVYDEVGREALRRKEGGKGLYFMVSDLLNVCFSKTCAYVDVMELIVVGVALGDWVRAGSRCIWC